ncbi:secretion system protein F [Duganella sp. FT80W]|jgi:tight adherence protein B|uniref:Secretion system protein F n=1 Tax=Duganella guangzhouensis TaxID=2666084 RepID=A0A6I2L0W7_9BURK|nr:type II secretion system F family protein [Duganella guangzhouensis]MRW90364.1 secretion system protein F [Duganella guangzhouensis]
MNNPLILVGAVFAAVLLVLWLVLYVGSRWFSRRQQQTAAAAMSDLEGMFIFTDANRLLAINVAVLIALPVLAWLATGNLVLVALCVVAAFVAPRYVVRHIAQRRLRQFEQQLPDALMMMGGSLRAGASLTMALDAVATEAKPPISQEFELLQRELRLGVDFQVALEALEQRVPLQDLCLVTAGMALSREVGANLAETLESLAKTIRAKLQMEGKIRSLTAQGKMQGLVMSALPLLLIVVLNMMEPEAMAPLFHAWYGWATMGVIVCTVGVGYHFIRKITSIDV